MALSDYLTNEEWDGCLYAYLNQTSPGASFGDSMDLTIKALLDEGYNFSGLDKEGHKKQQIQGTNNPFKLVRVFFGEKNGVKISEIMDSGREFLKANCSHLVAENDFDWQQALERIEESEK